MINTNANTGENVNKNNAIDIYQILIVSSISYKLKESQNKKDNWWPKRSPDL